MLSQEQHLITEPPVLTHSQQYHFALHQQWLEMSFVGALFTLFECKVWNLMFACSVDVLVCPHACIGHGTGCKAQGQMTAFLHALQFTTQTAMTS